MKKVYTRVFNKLQIYRMCLYIYIFRYIYIYIHVKLYAKPIQYPVCIVTSHFCVLVGRVDELWLQNHVFQLMQTEPDPKWSKIDWVRHHFPRILALVMQFFRIEQVFSVPKLHRHPLQWSKHSHSGEAGYNFWRLTTSQGQREAWWSQPKCQVPRNTCRHWGHFFGWACHLIHGFSWGKITVIIFWGPKCGSHVGSHGDVDPRTRL